MDSYIFNTKASFDITDPELHMVALYLPNKEDEKILYLVPAIEWGKGKYPLKVRIMINLDKFQN